LFSTTLVNIENSLPNRVVAASFVDLFKHWLDQFVTFKHWLDQFVTSRCNYDFTAD